MADEFDLVGQAEEEAIPAGAKLNFGKLTIKPRYLQWADKQPNEVNAQTYATLQPKERSLEYVFTVDIQEFNPALKFQYERKVQVGGLDWNKTLKESLKKLLGETRVTKEELPNTLRQLNGRYICAEDVPQIPTKGKPDRSKYSTISVLKVFDTREACYGEYFELYKKNTGDGGNGGSGSAAHGPSVPPGYTVDSWTKLKPELSTLFAKYATAMPAKVAARKTAEDYGATMEHVVELLGLKIDEPAAETPAVGTGSAHTFEQQAAANAAAVSAAIAQARGALGH